MAQTQMSAKELTGFNVYQTKNQTIYWDRVSKTAYIITRSDVSAFSTWQLRFPLSMMVSLIMMLLNLPFVLCIAVACILYVGSSLYFRFKFLPTLAVSVKWQKPKSEGFIKDTAKKFKYKSMMFAAIMLSIFVVMFTVDAYVYREIKSALIVYTILVIASLVAAALAFLVAFQRKKLDNQQVK